MSERERSGEDENWIENISEGIWSSDDDYYDDGDEDDAPTAAMPIEHVWAHAFTAARALRATKAAIASAEAADEIPLVGGSFRASPDDLDIDALDERLAALEQERSELEWDMKNRGWPPKGWTPATPEPAPSVDRESKGLARPKLDDVLQASLSPDEYQHWQWLDAQINQREVAARLGISQAAVSKREAKLRARVGEIYQATFGRPYPWIAIPKRQGGRRRKA